MCLFDCWFLFLNKINIAFKILIMNKRLLILKFPEGASTLYVNGKTFTRQEFYKAQRLESRRGKSGRFVSKVITT